MNKHMYALLALTITFGSIFPMGKGNDAPDIDLDALDAGLAAMSAQFDVSAAAARAIDNRLADSYTPSSSSDDSSSTISHDPNREYLFPKWYNGAKGYFFGNNSAQTSIQEPTRVLAPDEFIDAQGTIYKIMPIAPGTKTIQKLLTDHKGSKITATVPYDSPVQRTTQQRAAENFNRVNEQIQNKHKEFYNQLNAEQKAAYDRGDAEALELATKKRAQASAAPSSGNLSRPFQAPRVVSSSRDWEYSDGSDIDFDKPSKNMRKLQKANATKKAQKQDATTLDAMPLSPMQESHSQISKDEQREHIFSLLWKRTLPVALTSKVNSACKEFVQDSQEAFQQESENKEFNRKLQTLNDTERAHAIAQREQQRKQSSDEKLKKQEMDGIAKAREIAEEERYLKETFGEPESEEIGRFRRYAGLAAGIWGISKGLSPKVGGPINVPQGSTLIVNGNGTITAGSTIPETPSMASRAVSKAGAILGGLFSFKGGGSSGSQKSSEEPQGGTGNTGAQNSKPAGKCSDNCKILPEQGQKINGRYYTKHALERMAPKNFETMAELERRALARGFARGSKEFKDYVQPRDIPLSVVEDALTNGVSQIGTELDTIEYITTELKVITNGKGDVKSVFRI